MFSTALCSATRVGVRASGPRHALLAWRAASTSARVNDLDFDDAPVLRIVRGRAAERDRLLSELTEDMSSPEDITRIKKIKQLEPIHTAWSDWTRTRELLRESTPLLNDPDPDLRKFAEEDVAALTSTLTDSLTAHLPTLLVSASPTARLGALFELKSGVGGAEASLFLGEMLRMYVRLADSRGWRAATVAQNETDGGGVKDAILEIAGEGAYDALRWESGVHRVQRVPATETGGRTHTSTVAVVVLPLVEDTEQPVEDDLFKMEDIKLEVMRARGAGGQHVNKTESAVRLTHIPTGVTVSMQDERSQHQNRRRAFQVLRGRLLDRKLTREVAERRATRRALVSGADRSEKIRTYNWAQDRVTDHRIGLTIKNLEGVMEGELLHDILDGLKRHHDGLALEDMLEDVAAADGGANAA